MATGTDDFNALTSYGDRDGSVNKSTEFTTKAERKNGPHVNAAGYQSANKPVENIALAELLVNHDHQRRESISEIQRSNLNLVRSGNRTQLERGRATSDIGYGEFNKPDHWISRLSFAVILLCFLGLFLFSHKLQNYSNELRLAILSL